MYREAHTFFEDLFEATQLKRRKKITKLFSETDLLIIDKFEGKSYRLKEAVSRLSQSKQKKQDEKGKNMDLSKEDL